MIPYLPIFIGRYYYAHAPEMRTFSYFSNFLSTLTRLYISPLINNTSAIYWTKTCGPRLRANKNSDER